MKKTQYQIIQEILNNNKDVPQEVLNEGILSALIKGAKAVGRFAKKVMANSRARQVNTSKVEPKLTKPLLPKARKAPDKKSIQKVSVIKEPGGRIPYVKGQGIQMPTAKTNIHVTQVEYRPGVTNLKTTYYDYLSRRFSGGRFNKQMPALMQTFFGWIFVDHFEKNFTEWEAYKLGIIDASGNELRKAKNAKERASWNYMIKAIAVLRQNIEYAIPSNARLNYMLRNLKLVKESKTIDHQDKYLETIDTLMNECQEFTEQYIDNLRDGYTINTISEKPDQENNNNA